MVYDPLVISIFNVSGDDYSSWIGLGGVIIGSVLTVLLTTLSGYLNNKKKRKVVLNQLIDRLIFIQVFHKAIKEKCNYENIEDNLSENEINEIKRILISNYSTYTKTKNDIDILTKKFLELVSYNAKYSNLSLSSSRFILTASVFTQYVSEIDFNKRYLLRKRGLKNMSIRCINETNNFINDLLMCLGLPDGLIDTNIIKDDNENAN